jgi:tetratricopeptide (TPR) repeat protein
MGIWNSQPPQEDELTRSISISLRSPILERDAFRLINILALCPNGLRIEHIQKIGLYMGIVSLCKLKLALSGQGILRVLSPVRRILKAHICHIELHQYLQSQRPEIDEIVAKDRCNLIKLYLNQKDGIIEMSLLDREFGTLASEADNITEILTEGLKSDCFQYTSIRIAIKIADKLRSFGISFEPALKTARDAAEKKDLRMEVADLERYLGGNAYLHSDYQLAKERYKRALGFYESLPCSLDTTIRRAICTKDLGKLQIEAGKLGDAIAYFQQTIDLLRSLEESPSLETKVQIQMIQMIQIDATKGFADVYREQKKYPLAIETYQKARDLLEKLPNGQDIHVCKADCIQGIAACLQVSEQDQNRVIEQFRRALNIYEEAKDILGQANCHKQIGDIYCDKLNNSDEAERHYKHAEDLYIQIDNKLCFANLKKAWGDYFAKSSRFPRAYECYNHAISLYQATTNIHGEANCWKKLADTLLYLEKKHNDAREPLIKALGLFKNRNDDVMIAACNKGFGDIYMNNNDFENAHKYYKDAHTYYFNNKNDKNKNDEFGYMHCLVAYSEAKLKLAPTVYTTKKEKLCHEAKDFLMEAKKIQETHYSNDQNTKARITKLLIEARQIIVQRSNNGNSY